ncbi:hypothetical protein ZEAMMB73_Zm00001d007605 [Zea mays]|uniref:Uncharacterized protein n=1 Tax=Zea mays TaxID=4577 RepID=A0A1D6F7I1_MAIZE|nr:hypothetical protein ZEAMMB73_Zm00001d007605 [Zea mays]
MVSVLNTKDEEWWALIHSVASFDYSQIIDILLERSMRLTRPFVGADAAVFGSSGFDAAPADHPLVSGNVVSPRKGLKSQISHLPRSGEGVTSIPHALFAELIG